MSLEAMSAGISAVATVPAMGARIGSAAGGSFSPGLKGAGIFSETRPFIASTGSIPGGPIPKTSNILSSPDWSTVAKAKVPAISTAPKADPMRNLGFDPYVASPVTIAEKSISLNKGEWATLAKAPAKTIAQTVFSEAKPLMPENPVFSKTMTNKDLTVLVEGVYKQTPIEESVITKALVAEKEQSKKVVNLLAEVGLYTRDEAVRRVAKIVEKKGLVRADVETETETEADAEAMPLTESSAKKTKVKTKEVRVEVEDEDKKPEDKLLRQKPPEQVPVVDENAQASRKKDVKAKIADLFGKARRFGLEKIKSSEITEGLDKKLENRSLLLRQLLYPLLPDGSLDEAIKTVESFGELRDVSRMAEQAVEEQVDVILDNNVPVKLAPLEKSKQVSEKEVKRVLKYLQPESLVA
jgi:hypothetical protein